ncbi:Cytochrome b6 maturation protein CCB3/Ycf19 and related maturases [Commensalibacter communis]|uniref:YggT family (Ycf19) n=1 Tax=Commensalibacter communis TaxID=2972786 RepID=A0A9W4TM05_9PROT|nr:YggT family protein [Commensalibacter communis]CAI3937493.1 Cytochrome b6 maturation protein CCB3/Ycf19 and related maturases [Commensalibacter communis]CAI3938714.1 Cytochrome b6 maturation protein CCB3/Ycf19 and related maturases [Commensalibacter communis]CAI3939978.1 Cytochrome b6 maturation protein CCB3/Ycf19 and related maturases [Commensalibacter communis]CAI3942824.1 Cytochrome b6 maturation protein CCB3/Ycf19 and related maturases [Commensalibacter communis]CAI3943836.1 Cytochrome 
MFELYNLLNILLNGYMLILLAYCIFSFLFSFGVVNPNSNIIRGIYMFLSQMCDPVLNAIRQILPSLGAIDISPVVVFLAIDFIIRPLLRYMLLGY